MVNASRTWISSVYGRLLSAVAVGAVACGLFLRFWHLGGAPLAVDEYYFGSSILNILARGLPEFACGGYYSRGLLVQYLGSMLVSFDVGLEFASRFWPAAASVMAIVAVWKIANIASTRTVATIAVILCSLSLWEIEFARFGRMYSPFQAVVLWYLYFQMLHLVKGKESARWAYLGLSLLAVFIYKGAALLLALNFLVLIWPGRRWNIQHIICASLLLPIGFIDRLISFRYYGVPEDKMPPPLPGDSVSTLPIDLPALPFSPVVLAAVGFVLLTYILWMYRRRIQFVHLSAAYWLLVLFCICLGAMGFAIGLLLSGVLMRLPFPLQGDGKNQLSLPLAIGSITLAWLAVVFAAQLFFEQNLRSSVSATVDYVLNFPDVYYKVVLPWMQAIPVTTVLIGILALYSLANVLLSRSSAETRNDALRYLIAATILLVMLVGLLQQPYRTTRYTYFLYPVILIIAAAGIEALSTRFATRHATQAATLLLVLGILFGFAEDFSVSHMLRINEPEYRFRTAYSGRTASHYYTRWDYRGVADFVNANRESTDQIVVFDQPATYYLEGTDAVFLREGSEIHNLTWACGGERHLWSNAPLLDTENEVEQLLGKANGATWFIMRAPTVRWRDPLEALLVDRFTMSPLYTSVDGNLMVYKKDRAR